MLMLMILPVLAGCGKTEGILPETTEAPIPAIRIVDAPEKMGVGDRLVLCAEVANADSAAVQWSVSDSAIAQVAEDGTVIHDEKLCIGCQACVAACPYGAPQYIADKQKVGKCDACAAIRAAGGNPVCVDACPLRALEFGDLDELAKKHAGENLVKEIPVMPKADLTGPSYLINAKPAMMQDGAEEMYL